MDAATKIANPKEFKHLESADAVASSLARSLRIP